MKSVFDSLSELASNYNYQFKAPFHTRVPELSAEPGANHRLDLLSLALLYALNGQLSRRQLHGRSVVQLPWCLSIATGDLCNTYHAVGQV